MRECGFVVRVDVDGDLNEHGFRPAPDPDAWQRAMTICGASRNCDVGVVGQQHM
jgi:hypothetical protein